MGRRKNIRNDNGIWINTDVFREEAIHFEKYGHYCSDPWGSMDWYDYWTEQRRRCIKGYSVGGCKITGDHYYYLNFCPIRKVESIDGKRSDKITGFPDFWDGDYNYFWIREIAKNGILEPSGISGKEKSAISKLPKEKKLVKFKKLFDDLHTGLIIKPEYLDGGYNLIVAKGRRRGFTYKAAAVGANNFVNYPRSLTIFGAQDKKYLYPAGSIFSMAISNINFATQNTAWQHHRDVVNKISNGNIRASYIETVNGVKTEKGFMSELLGLTFNDDPNAARGKDAKDVFFEEAGAFGSPGLLKESYAATEDVVQAGSIKTGMITVFGTSGELDSGTVDYADMFKRPESFSFLPLQNIWDENMEETTCGYFHPINLNMEGFYDKKGNTQLKEAKDFELSVRKKLIDSGASTSELQKRLQEKPLSPSEAFGAAALNNFPVIELQKQLDKVIANNWNKTKATPVEFSREKGEVKAKPILDGSAKVIDSYFNLPTDKRGCPVVYEPPMSDPPPGLYKIGYDPVRQDQGTSLAAIIVYKGRVQGDYNNNIIVAEYIGRKDNTDDIDAIAEYFAEYYSAKIMYENEVPGTKNYFRRIKKLHLLALQPDAVISKNIKKSKVARVFGCHVNKSLKDGGERYSKDWLQEVNDFDENDSPVTTIDKIYSKRLLEELIYYNRDGNFDLVSALFMVMIQAQEEELGKEYNTNKINENVKDLLELKDIMFKNS